MTGFTTMYIPLGQHLLTPLAICPLATSSSGATGGTGGGTGMLFSATDTAGATTTHSIAFWIKRPLITLIS